MHTVTLLLQERQISAGVQVIGILRDRAGPCDLPMRTRELGEG